MAAEEPADDGTPDGVPNVSRPYEWAIVCDNDLPLTAAEEEAKAADAQMRKEAEDVRDAKKKLERARMPSSKATAEEIAEMEQDCKQQESEFQAKRTELKQKMIAAIDVDGDGQITEDDLNRAKDPMVRALVLKLESIGLDVHATPSRSGKYFFIQCSASEEALEEWAERMQLRMRLRTEVSDLKDAIAAAEEGDDVKQLQEDLKKGEAQREHADFGVCSGERQRIVKYMIENNANGLLLEDSLIAKGNEEEAVTTEGATVTSNAMYDDSATIRDQLIAGVMQEQQHSENLDSTESDERLIQLAELEADTVQPDVDKESLIRDRARIWPVITDYFPLHDAQELQHLADTWGSLSIITQIITNFDVQTMGLSGLRQLTVQPIDEIRDYFGEQIALYFAFLRIYTEALIWPTMIGILTMIGHILNGVEGNPLSLVYSIAVSFWSVYFLTQWKRRQNELMFLWGTSDFESSETARAEFKQRKDKAKLELNAFTGEMEMVPKNSLEKYGKVATSIGIICLFVLVVIFAATIAMWIKLLDDTWLGKAAPIAGSLFNVVCIVVFGKVYEMFAIKLNDWEHHRTQTQYEDAQIMKSFVFQMINNYFVLFFIAFMKQGTIGFPTIGMEERNSTCVLVTVSCNKNDLGSAGCDDNEEMQIPSCMSELEIQLMVVFVVKQFAFQFVEIGVPLLKAKNASRIRNINIKKAQAEIQEAKELGVDVPDIGSTDVGEQRVMEPYPSVFADYNELAIQFGYSTLFAVAFPLAPFFAVANNCLEIRSDAYKLCQVHRRPEFQTRMDIGAWETVFETIAVSAVITNAALIGFVGSQMSQYLSLTEYKEFTQDTRQQDYRLWFIAVLVEHMILVLRFSIKAVVPAVPSWIGKAKLQMESANARSKAAHDELLLKRR